MSLAETIYQRSLNLPEFAAREALDFIEFLEQRYNGVIPTALAIDELDFIEFLEQRYNAKKNQNDTEAFLAAIEGGLSEDFPDDINDDDLGVDAHRESLD